MVDETALIAYQLVQVKPFPDGSPRYAHSNPSNPKELAVDQNGNVMYFTQAQVDEMNPTLIGGFPIDYWQYQFNGLGPGVGSVAGATLRGASLLTRTLPSLTKVVTMSRPRFSFFDLARHALGRVVAKGAALVARSPSFVKGAIASYATNTAIDKVITSVLSEKEAAPPTAAADVAAAAISLLPAEQQPVALAAFNRIARDMPEVYYALSPTSIARFVSEAATSMTAAEADNLFNALDEDDNYQAILRALRMQRGLNLRRAAGLPDVDTWQLEVWATIMALIGQPAQYDYDIRYDECYYDADPQSVMDACQHVCDMVSGHHDADLPTAWRQFDASPTFRKVRRAMLVGAPSYIARYDREPGLWSYDAEYFSLKKMFKKVKKAISKITKPIGAVLKQVAGPLAGAAGFVLGGPAGMMIGSQLGQMFGQSSGGNAPPLLSAIPEVAGLMGGLPGGANLGQIGLLGSLFSQGGAQGAAVAPYMEMFTGRPPGSITSLLPSGVSSVAATSAEREAQAALASNAQMASALNVQQQQTASVAARQQAFEAQIQRSLQENATQHQRLAEGLHKLQTNMALFAQHVGQRIGDAP